MASTNSFSRLFISYSRKNKERVYALADALEKAGMEIWIDREEIDPLDDFPAQIRDGLACSHALLAWYSPEYAQSSYCQKELTAAWICTQRLTSDALSRILIVNPEESVEHIALGDVGRQNYLSPPKDEDSLSAFIHLISNKLVHLSGDFASLHEFKKPDWYPDPQPGSSRFVGRMQELWRIHTALNPVGIADHENPGVIVQLSGMGGIGKSLLAIEYAKRFGAAYPGGIFWLRASGFNLQNSADSEAICNEGQRQIEELDLQIKGLALLHSIPIQDKDFIKVRKALGEKLASGGTYLWIVDDLPPRLDQQLDLPGWYAPGGNGHTLITTRSKEYEGLGRTVEIDVLDPAAALDLLTQKRKPQNEQERQDAEGLADDLGRHALALDVAGHFLLKTLSFAAFRAKLSSVQSDLLGKISAELEGQLPDGHEKSIVITLLQSLHLLKIEGLSLLWLATQLQAGTPIPFRLASKSFSYTFGLEEQAAWDYLTRAVNQLETHSLASVSLGGLGGDALLIHMLVSYALLHLDPTQESSKKARQGLREGALLALLDLLPEVTDIRNHPSLGLEVAHARHLAREPGTLNEARLCVWLSSFASEHGNYREGLVVARKGLTVLTGVLGVDHPDTLVARNIIADLTSAAGNAREALRLHQELLADQIRVQGEDDPLTLTTRFNIATTTAETGHAHEALRLFRELLPEQIRVLSADHRETLRTRGNIAHLIGEEGDAPEALRLYQELLTDQIKALGADHPDNFPIRSNISALIADTGDAPEALRLLRELLTDELRVFGADHPKTFKTRFNIAELTGKTGEAGEALRLFRELLFDQIRVLGPDHPLTLHSRHNIAGWTAKIGDVHEALRLLEELLPDLIRVLGADHPDTLITRESIAGYNGRVGNASQALRLFQELLADQTRVLGASHPDTLNTDNNVIAWTALSGLLPLLRKMQPDMTWLLGGDHPEMVNTGELHKVQLPMLLGLLPILTKVLGADHPEVFRTRVIIAAWTGQTGDEGEALRLFRELLPDQTRVLGVDHPDTINTREWIKLMGEQ